MRNLNFSAFASRLLLTGFIAFSSLIHAQNSLTNVAGEYPIIGSLPGDQMMSQIAFDLNGGWVVWQDNAVDGDGFGIGVRHLNSTLSGDLGLSRVNQIGVGDQENPQLTMLKNGGAAFVWQGGRQGFQKVFSRFMNPDGTFLDGDIQVNTYTNREQITPVLSCLNNSNVVVAWSSWAQDGDGYGIFGRLMSAAGAPIGSEFQINATTAFNQKAPSVAALANGNFIVAWSSEARQFATQQTTFQDDTNQYPVISTNTVTAKIFGRIFNSAGSPITGEFVVSGNAPICATPSVVANINGGFLVAWNQFLDATNSWDVYARSYTVAGSALSSPFRVNTYTYGDQIGAKAAASGTNCFIVWTSLGQDTSMEGIYGQFVSFEGLKLNAETRVNTTIISKQVQPSLSVDGSGRYVVAWSSYVGGSPSFDLFAQRFSADAGLPVPSAPYIFALDQSTLRVTWPELAGYSVASYELYIDGSSTPLIVNGVRTNIANLGPSSTHTFQLLFQLTDGRRSSLSPVASGTTWGADANHDGLPDDWQAAQWGSNPANWPSATADSDNDGASNLSEFLAGTDPKDANSILKTRVVRSGLQMTFSWNTQPGAYYQVQTSTNMAVWQDFGTPRFANGNTDSVSLGANGYSSFYRVILLR